MIRTTAAIVAATLLVAACGSSGGDPDSATAPSGDAANVTGAVCAKDAAAKKVALPDSFPSAFPMPPGTVIYSVDDRGSAGIVVTGVTSSPFRTVLKAMQARLPAAGFRAEDGEAEPHDAESDWESDDFQGRWAIREIPQCAGNTLVNVVARKHT